MIDLSPTAKYNTLPLRMLLLFIVNLSYLYYPSKPCSFFDIVNKVGVITRFVIHGRYRTSVFVEALWKARQLLSLCYAVLSNHPFFFLTVMTNPIAYPPLRTEHIAGNTPLTSYTLPS